MSNLTESRFPGKCIICDQSFPEGEPIYYEGNKAWHQRHGKTPEPPADYVAQSSADVLESFKTGVQADFAELKALVRQLIAQGAK